MESLDVYLNGKKVGGTDYGYLPVWADLSGRLKDGENLIEVWCSTGSLGGSRWYTGAGLFRDAKIIVKPEVITDDKMVILARDIAKKIEDELTYPGQIKVHLLRETKAVDYAK